MSVGVQAATASILYSPTADPSPGICLLIFDDLTIMIDTGQSSIHDILKLSYRYLFGLYTLCFVSNWVVAFETLQFRLDSFVRFALQIICVRCQSTSIEPNRSKHLKVSGVSGIGPVNLESVAVVILVVCLC